MRTVTAGVMGFLALCAVPLLAQSAGNDTLSALLAEVRLLRQTLERSATRTGIAAIGVPPHIKDRVLNHVSNRSEMDEVYDQYDYRAEIRAALERRDRAVNAIVKNERVAFGSWEADVQAARDQMIAERGENLISFRARA